MDLFFFLGTWDVTITSRNMSSNGMNPKLTLTACDDKGASASICIPKGSFKRTEAYRASLDLEKKFSTICKVRLEVEDTDRETWHCRKVKPNDASIPFFVKCSWQTYNSGFQKHLTLGLTNSLFLLFIYCISILLETQGGWVSRRCKLNGSYNSWNMQSWCYGFHNSVSSIYFRVTIIQIRDFCPTLKHCSTLCYWSVTD